MWYQILIRITGMLCISGGCWLAGWQMSDVLKRRKNFFRDTVGLIQYLEKEMLQRRTALNEALDEAAALFGNPWKPILNELSQCLIQYSGSTFLQIWNSVLKNHLKNGFLKDEEWQCFSRIATAFCGSDTAVQKTLMDSCLEQIKDLERKAAEEYVTRGSLYRRLSVLAAAFMILILI